MTLLATFKIVYRPAPQHGETCSLLEGRLGIVLVLKVRFADEVLWRMLLC